MSVMAVHKDTGKCQAKKCRCGKDMEYTVGTISFLIKDKLINIHHVPHFECAGCGEQLFDLSLGLSSLAVKAYKLGKSDIEYSEPEEA